MKKGFTLVELSIVLVIIGLLIGGILVAQSLIENAKMKRFIRQIQQFDIAVDSFQSRYKNLPGDNILFNAADTIVDGQIKDALASSGDLTGEIAQFWNDLSLSGMKSEKGGNYSVISGGGIIGENMPETEIQDGFGVAAGYFANPYTPSLIKNRYLVSLFSETSTRTEIFLEGNLLTPPFTLSASPFQNSEDYVGKFIDAKMDDGDITTGSVLYAIGFMMSGDTHPKLLIDIGSISSTN